LKGRQEAEAVDRAGLRLRLLRMQAKANDIVLLFQDESEALTHPYLAHVWARRGEDLRIPAPGQARKVAMLGALDVAANELIIETSLTKRSADFIALLAKLDERYAPHPGRPAKAVVLVLDNGPIHTSKASRAALEARPWLTIEWLPKYAPELNDIERSWRDLKRHFLAHHMFRDLNHLDCAIHSATVNLNAERTDRTKHMSTNLRIAA
jgi:transposase